MKKSVQIILIIVGVLLIILIPVLLYTKLNNDYQKRHNTKEVDSFQEELKIRDNISLEINSPLLTAYELFSNDIKESYVIKYYLDGKEIEVSSYDKVGTYDVVITINNKDYKTTLTIQDTTKPDLKLKEVTINEGETYKIEDFIDSCTDNSGDSCTYAYQNQVDYSKEGTYDITIIAKDNSNNEIIAPTKLIIKKNSSNVPKNNNSGSNKTSNNQTKEEDNNPNKPKFIETKKDVSTTSEDFKYGVKINKTTTTTYDLYNDGTTKNQKTNTKTTYDYSNYQATAKDLLPEAIENRSKYAAEANEVLENTNIYREELGLQKLVLDEDLMKVAMIRAMEMGYGNKLSHMRPNGDFCFSVADELGFGDFWGENLAWGQGSGKQATTWWRNSPGHYMNMVGDYTKLGVGVLKFNGRYLWVQVFA